MPERLSPAVLVWINSLCELEPPRLAPTSPGPAPRIERIEELNDGIILGEIVAAVSVPTTTGEAHSLNYRNQQ